jgi:cobalt-zinc-cadmium efflux system membrane fusion protein
MKRINIILLAFVILFFYCAKDQVHDHDQTGEHQHESTENSKTASNDHDHESNSGQTVKVNNSEVNQTVTDDHNHLHIHQDMVVKKGIKTDLPKLKSYVKKGRITGVVKNNKLRSYLVHTRVSGYIHALYKDFGDSVNKNGNLCAINSLELLEIKKEFTKSYLDFLKFRESFLRAEKLYAKKALNKKEFISRKTEYESAMSESFTNEEKLISIGIPIQSLDRMKNGLSENNKRVIREFLSALLIIKSPINGIVMSQDLHIGEFLQNDKLLYKISDLSKVWLDFNVKESDLGYVKLKQNILIKNENLSKTQYAGKVINIAQAIDPDIRTIKVRVEIINKNPGLKPGMFVSGYYETQSIKKRISIPQEAIVKVFGIDGVFIEDGDGFKFAPVKIIASDFKENVFVQGLALDSRIVVKGAFYLKAEHELNSGSVDPHAGHSH